MTEVKSMVEPDGVLDNFRWETVALIGIWLVHAPNSHRLRVNLSVPSKGFMNGLS
jgi:hypothetical protein